MLQVRHGGDKPLLFKNCFAASSIIWAAVRTELAAENRVMLTTVFDPLRAGVPPHFGGNSLKFQVVCPQNGTAVLKG